ncbi:hypothetical protein ONZ51_g12737 [Trametes cubensis]|uniref:Uncharacterized protein n=1 Tax=Trametes cubensis TaxID=1111947 RepID=A0AAD7X568_9APHY|nr:hypothetical protein ONZ51_g12737 [Trametes cubensis]
MAKSKASRRVTASAPDRYDPLAPSSVFVPLQTYTTKVYGPISMARHREQIEEHHAANLMSLGKSTRALLSELRSSSSATAEVSTPANDDPPMDIVMGGNDDDDDGDVWVDMPDEGQEDDVIQMRDILAMHPRTYRPKDEPCGRIYALEIRQESSLQQYPERQHDLHDRHPRLSHFTTGSDDHNVARLRDSRGGPRP